MEAYRNFNHLKLFLSLKRDLAMVSYLIDCFIYILVPLLAFYSKGKTPFFFFLGHTASFRGRGMGEEHSW